MQGYMKGGRSHVGAGAVAEKRSRIAGEQTDLSVL